MKKRDKYFHKEKHYRALLIQQDANNLAQMNLGWVDLEVPIHIGWRAKLEPRQDIQNRADAEVFWEVCKLCTKPFNKKKDGFWWNSKKRYNHRLFLDHKPHIPQIKEYQYLTLSAGAKKLFKSSTPPAWSFGNWYACDVPNFFFDIAYEKVWKTKVKLIDTDLLKEEAEIEGKIKAKYWKLSDKSGKHDRAPGRFTRKLNVSQRRKNRAMEKQALNVQGLEELDELDFYSHYKGAAWEYY